MKYNLNDIAVITSSKRIFANEYKSSGIPFYRGKEITQLYNHKAFSDLLYISEDKYNELIKNFGVPQENDILITAVGTIGSLYLVNKDDRFYFKDGNLIWLKNIDKTKVIPKYLYYLLSTNETQSLINSITIGSTQTALTIEGVKMLNFDFPKLKVQQHIVDTIGSVDSLIEKNEEIILKTHKLIDDIYLKETNTLELVKISELDYFNISKSGIKKFENNKIYLDTSAVSDTNITDESYIIDYKNRPSRANMQPKVNTIWFAKLKDSPKYILVKNQKRLLENFVFSTGFMGLESEEYIVNYLYALILSTSFTNQKNLLSNGATMQGINNEIFMNILVPNVDKTIAKLIGEKLENYVNLICRLQEKNYKLKQIKETLLQKYFG